MPLERVEHRRERLRQLQAGGERVADFHERGQLADLAGRVFFVALPAGPGGTPGSSDNFV